MRQEEIFFSQLPKRGPEQRPKELDVDAITRGLELEVFSAGIPIEEYGDPYAGVKPLIHELIQAGRSRDVVMLFQKYTPLSGHDDFGGTLDMFGDTEQLYRFTVDELVKNGHVGEAEGVLQHLKKHGPQNMRMVADSFNEKFGEKDETTYLNGLRVDLLLAKLRYSTDQTAETLSEEADLAGDLIASMPNGTVMKALAYSKLAEAKHAAGIPLESELDQAEHLITTLREKEIDKFHWMAEVVKTSVIVDADSERRLQALLQCGYRVLHSNDETGETFKSLIQAMGAMRGKKIDPSEQIMSPQLAVNVSSPLNEVIREVAKKGNINLALQLTELELHEDWTRWEGYAAVIEGLPTGIALPDAVEPRLKELCRELSSPLELDKCVQLVLSLVNRGQSMFAMELVDLTELEPKHKRELYAEIAGEIRRSGGSIDNLFDRLPVPRTMDELIQLGLFDEAEMVFEGLGIRDKIRQGVVLIRALIESGRDVKKVANSVYRALQEDKPLNEFDSDYDWAHDGSSRYLFMALLRLKPTKPSGRRV